MTKSVEITILTHAFPYHILQALTAAEIKCNDVRYGIKSFRR